MIYNSLCALIFSLQTASAKELCQKIRSDSTCILKASTCHPHVSNQGTSSGTVQGIGNIVLNISKTENGNIESYRQIENISSYDSIYWVTEPDSHQLTLQQATALALSSCEMELRQIKEIYPLCEK